MYGTENTEKANQSKPKIKTVIFMTLWFVLAAAAMLLIAFAGHILRRPRTQHRVS